MGCGLVYNDKFTECQYLINSFENYLDKIKYNKLKEDEKKYIELTCENSKLKIRAILAELNELCVKNKNHFKLWKLKQFNEEFQMLLEEESNIKVVELNDDYRNGRILRIKKRNY